MTARLFTASWRALAEASMLGPLAVQPVRISRGAPRFWPEADTFPAVDDLMPDGWMFAIKDLEKFGRCYRRKLHTIGLRESECCSTPSLPAPEVDRSRSPASRPTLPTSTAARSASLAGGRARPASG